MGLFQYNRGKMKTISSTKFVDVREGSTVEVDKRVITVTGPRGTIVKSFKHIQCEIVKVGDKQVRIDLWFAKSKELANLRTIASHLINIMKGVTIGFQYKMRAVYAHFPISVVIGTEKDTIVVANFLGDKVNRRVPVLEGVTVSAGKLKDEFVFEGIDIEAVSRNCALLHQSCLVKNKDIRKFLDGIYVSEKGHIE